MSCKLHDQPASEHGRGPVLTVKSAGCEKRMAQLSLIHSCQCMGPWVVSALKSGTTLPRRRTCRTVECLSDGWKALSRRLRCNLSHK